MLILSVAFWMSASIIFFLSKMYISRPRFAIIGLNTSFILYMATAIILMSQYSNFAVLLLGTLATFMAITVLRVLVDNYRHQHYRSYKDMVLLHVLTLLVLVGLQLPIDFASSNVYEVMRYISLIFSLSVLVNVITNAFKYRFKRSEPDQKYEPSVSLLIPARNERHALEDALKSALAIDYNKLEIIVLDDESQDDTPEIIKSFAHDGIRFIEGGPLPEHWIGKNYALQRLAQEASGSILVFCDVDSRLAPQSLQRIVNVFADNKISMVSIFPKRHHINFWYFFVQTLEALRKLATPYWAVPELKPAASTCWALRKDTLRQMQDFEPTRNSLAPHYYFSKQLDASEQRFFFSDFKIPVTIRKRLSSEIESRIRRFYPGVGGSFLNVFFLSILALFVLFPFGDLVFSYGSGLPLLSVIAASGFLASHLIALTKISASTWYMGVVNFIPSILLEIIILCVSFVKYEFGSVKWKDRTLPTGHVLQSSQSIK